MTNLPTPAVEAGSVPCRPCSTCGVIDRYPSGPCRPCTQRRGAANREYWTARSQRHREAQLVAVTADVARVGVIYGLVDPTTRLLRYVGQTQQRLLKRLAAHRRAWQGSNSHLPVNRWIAKLREQGLEPEAVVLEGPLQVAMLDEAERRHIATHKTQGADLLNLCPGGRASLGTWCQPAEAIKRSADAKRGKPRTVETRARLAEANKGKKQSPETVAKRVAKIRGRKQSAEHIAKRAAAIAATKGAKPRSATCPRGHLWTDANTYEGKRSRNCRTCARERATLNRKLRPTRKDNT